jgi:2-hydroxychromene-2-carboxylate isomerase
MSETIRFHFDPLCPWAWQAARWIREVAPRRDLTIEWRLFSLHLINEGNDDPLRNEHLQGTPALRTFALVRRSAGNEAVGRVYEEIGNRIHEGDEELNPGVVATALAAAGLKPDLVDAALEDDSTTDDVRAEHDAAVAEVGAFGVPTIVLSSGAGIFGPVVSTAPSGEPAAVLWDHVRYLIETDAFFELKRERDRKPATV